jgi:hypothetical protein
MKIKVIKAAPYMWYSEFVGKVFHVIGQNSRLDYVFSGFLMFLQSDVEVVNSGEGLITDLNNVGIA